LPAGRGQAGVRLRREGLQGRQGGGQAQGHRRPGRRAFGHGRAAAGGLGLVREMAEKRMTRDEPCLPVPRRPGPRERQGPESTAPTWKRGVFSMTFLTSSRSNLLLSLTANVTCCLPTSGATVPFSTHGRVSSALRT